MRFRVVVGKGHVASIAWMGLEAAMKGRPGYEFVFLSAPWLTGAKSLLPGTPWMASGIVPGGFGKTDVATGGHSFIAGCTNFHA